MISSQIVLLRHRERPASAWKNGGGETREVAVFPPYATWDDFAWRLSIAEVTAPGPFSRFDGIDRILTPLAGRLRLEMAEAAFLLDPLHPHRFAGEAAIMGVPVGGPVRDFNVMTRRGAWRAEIHPIRGQALSGVIAGADHAAVLAVDPQVVRFGKEALALEALDVLLLAPGAIADIALEGAGLVVGLWRDGGSVRDAAPPGV